MNIKRFICLFSALALIISAVGCSNHTTESTEPNGSEALPAPVVTTDGVTEPAQTDEVLTEPVLTEPPFEIYEGPSADFKFTLSNFIENNDFSAYPEFLAACEKSFIVPALAEKMVPQGMDIWEERGWLLISGYFDDPETSDRSVLLAIDMNTGAYVGEYYLTNADGTPHTSHAGGVAVTEKNIYISASSQLHRIPLSSIIQAGQSGNIMIADSVSVPVRASFCNYSEGYLWVGDFYYGSSYPTDTWRHMKNREGRKYCAWTVGYELDENSENGFKPGSIVEGSYATPDIIFSMTERIQGFTVGGGKVILSQSYGRNNDSVIYLYENPMGTDPHQQVELNGNQIDLYFLDGKLNCETLKTPPMSEGIAARNGALYILYESGADKYANGGGKCPTENIWLYKLK